VELLFILIVFLSLFLAFEFRVRKPDQLALFEKKGNIFSRKGKFYPRHFTLIIPLSNFSYNLEITGEAKGKLKLKIKLILSVTPDKNNLGTLVQTGGWSKNTVQNASNEINNQLNYIIQEFTEKHDIDEISQEKLTNYLKSTLETSSKQFGLQVVTITVQNMEAENNAIAEAIRDRETARILEATESVKQNSRIASFRAKSEADEKIANYEHQLEIKKLELIKIEDEREAKVNHERVKEELKNQKLRLEIEKEELNLLASHPELLILSPQAARLAEASRSLKNAKTVVSLSGNDFIENNSIGKLLQETLTKITNNLNSSK